MFVSTIHQIERFSKFHNFSGDGLPGPFPRGVYPPWVVEANPPEVPTDLQVIMHWGEFISSNVAIDIGGGHLPSNRYRVLEQRKPSVGLGLINPQAKSILVNFRTEIKLWYNFSLPYMLTNFTKFSIESGMLAIYSTTRASISHVHWAYDYLGPFGVLWVHIDIDIVHIYILTQKLC